MQKIVLANGFLFFLSFSVKKEICSFVVDYIYFFSYLQEYFEYNYVKTHAARKKIGCILVTNWIKQLVTKQ